MNGEQTAGKSWGRFKVSEDKGCGERHINKQIPPYLLSHPLCPSPCRYSEVTIDTILFWSFLTIRLKLFLATLSLTSKTGTWLPSSKSSLILFENWNTSPIPTRGKLAGASARGRGVQMPKGEKIFWSGRWHYIKGLILSVILVASRKVFGLWQKFSESCGVSNMYLSIHRFQPSGSLQEGRDSNSFGWESHVKLRVMCL